MEKKLWPLKTSVVFNYKRVVSGANDDSERSVGASDYVKILSIAGWLLGHPIVGLKPNFATQPIYLITTTTSKVSIALFLLRFAPNKGLRNFLWGMIYFMIIPGVYSVRHSRSSRSWRNARTWQFCGIHQWSRLAGARTWAVNSAIPTLINSVESIYRSLSSCPWVSLHPPPRSSKRQN
ncbi:uncharacterized protein L3040_005325 [Drepanopeziza brunnea f. sp. 'multigermtubi']|uniref:uncharacterized protein n=1 Tax=Drepanopeziza brunnea f. sp. 'multigermtubi' TaxID=698441 RepID=UPI0023A19372|nr:hypothetical protein L3040_005325 [Drepanopeziza brunnea f. sp. 'multigermtubi']